MHKLALGVLIGSLLTLLALHGSSRAAPTEYFGPYAAVVTSNADPLQELRLQVDVPALATREHLWAAPCVPYTGGTPPVLPPVGAAIWVEFQGGDRSYPVWIGWRPDGASHPSTPGNLGTTRP
jgi:hypothetical protein